MTDQPPYARIAAEIRRRIDAGELRPGARVPSTRQIAVRWGVAIATATKALAALRHEGLVHAVPGVGTVVSPTAPGRADQPRRAGQAAPRATRAGVPDDAVRARIVRAAIRIADAEGLAALTMRRIATELDVATMSLYRHVRNKDEIVALMADAAFAEAPLPEPGGGWRDRLELSAKTQWGLYRAHPWLARTMSLSRPLLVPHGMLHIEWALRALDGLGLDDDTVMHTAITLFGYVRGTAADLEVEEQATQDTGVGGEEWLEAQEDAMMALLAGGSFPAFAAIRRRPGVDISVQSLFEYGLERLLDGVAAVIAKQRAPAVESTS
ncbi:TetR/AcrR family transcriptional regulator C-terminal domain-containing protein [Streptomyces netropsis]|uniref:AcrR family transcriptional regulator n=1 Tax=Streptomyces netropsis TaxID=55404 RepID=A0A7W7L8P5_STRNE|nr:TetR/AcrR family transcriptional regulator C-terminal domain-containing protein [Streptomyces netropsis]MBB4885705.1 AcrR family transcriptional regulator [Streptomyces netropsis]GGR36667.1 GntR family transcriptional regulator [Streptomyces netropsis]